MKSLKCYVLSLGLMLLGISMAAQEVKVNDNVYEVKKDLIFKNGVDVTNILTADEKSQIFAAFEKSNIERAEAIKTQKRIEKAEKEQKKAEKKQKKAEKALKQKEKAQSNYDKATKKHQDALKKYEKLKRKGKLSQQGEKKWLEKIEKLNANISKTKRKL